MADLGDSSEEETGARLRAVVLSRRGVAAGLKGRPLPSDVLGSRIHDMHLCLMYINVWRPPTNV